jgi:hypothetical protein
MLSDRRGTNLHFFMVFGRFSVAIVTPFEAPDENSRQPINEHSLEILIGSVLDGLLEAKLHLLQRGVEENMIGGFELFIEFSHLL